MGLTLGGTRNDTDLPLRFIKYYQGWQLQNVR